MPRNTVCPWRRPFVLHSELAGLEHFFNVFVKIRSTESMIGMEKNKIDS